MPRAATYNLRVNTAQAQSDMERFFTSVKQQQRSMMNQAGAGGRGRGSFQEPIAGLRMLQAGVAAFVGSAAVQQIGRTVIELNDLGTEAIRTGKAFEYISGGTAQAAANLEAVQRASQGTLDTITAQQIATSALNLGLARSADELARVTTIARGVVAVSPVINDMQSAFSELSLTMANMSWRRLDQLGLSVAEVRAEYERLLETNADLSEEQAFSQAVLDVAERKFGELASSAEFAATGLERLRTRWKELRMEAGIEIAQSGLMEAIADDVDRMDAKLAAAEKQAAQAQAQRAAQNAYDSVAIRIRQLEEDIQLGEALSDYLNKTGDLRGKLGQDVEVSKMRRELAGLTDDLMSVTLGVARADPEIMAMAQAFGGMTDAINPSSAALRDNARAMGEVEAQYRNLSEMRQGTPDPMFADTGGPSLEYQYANYTRMENLADIMRRIGRAAEAGVPGADALARALDRVAIDVQKTGQFTAEHIEVMSEAVRWWNMGGEVLTGLADATSPAVAGIGKMTQATNLMGGALGTAAEQIAIFNANAAGLVATAAQIEQAVGIASGTSRPGRTSAVLPKASLDNDQIAKITAPGMITEYARGAPGMSPAERATWESWQRAASDTADAWVSELKSALQSVPGLFGTSDVTAEDMADAEAGTYQEKADEYLRQLRDEVRNGVDYAGVDINDAAARLGIDPGQGPEAILRQFEKAWADSSLFAGGQNLDLINEEAVQRELARQEASRSGRAAIESYFGVPQEGTGSGAAIGASFGQAAQQEAPAIGQAIAANMAPAPSSMFGGQSADMTGVIQSMTGSLKAAVSSDDNKAQFEEVGRTAIRYIFTGARDGELLDDLAEQLLEQMYGAIADAMNGEGEGGE